MISIEGNKEAIEAVLYTYDEGSRQISIYSGESEISSVLLTFVHEVFDTYFPSISNCW